MTHEKNMMDYQSFLQKKNLAMKPGDMLYGKSYCFDKANVHLGFLDSEPKLGDFVPTNEDGEVIERPEILYISTAQPPSEHESFRHDKLVKEYQSALDRRLWKDWKVMGSCNMTITIINSDMQLVSFHTISKQCRVKETVKSNYNELITSGVKLERITNIKN